MYNYFNLIIFGYKACFNLIKIIEEKSIDVIVNILFRKSIKSEKYRINLKFAFAYKFV